jgi:non-specific serine/threonine protein kinase/serine/threonine-protein kinase
VPDREGIADGPGQQLGAYRLVRLLGQGGMGRVYLAERNDSTYRGQVAIKLMRRGLDGDAVLRRFLNERQILAGLNHPNIARLLDGGVTADGFPYIVMEYVDGQPIDAWCRARETGLSARLELFLQVCAAVQHAHQRLLIHRDIKPGNVLVTAEGVPKLVDFGIAKILTPDLAAAELVQTAEYLPMLTPQYAAPEQVLGAPVTTATDVYALGLLLYELLTGVSAFAGAQATTRQMFDAVIHDEPRRPSIAAGTRDRRLEGDLDNIVLMALRKEPGRRYDSVERLAADLRHHLAGEPVAAQRATFGYVAGKFVRRNAIPVAAAGVAAIALVAGAGVAAWQAHVANAERQRAEKRFEDVRRLANAMIFEVNAEIENGPTKAREVLVGKALEYIDSLAAEKSLEPALRRELAAAYEQIGDIEGNYTIINQLGRTQDAVVHYERALALREGLVQSDPDNLEYQIDLAASFHALGDMRWTRGDVVAAADYYTRAVAACEQIIARDASLLKAQIALARAHTYLANVMYSRSRPSLLRYEDSLTLHRRTTDALRALRRQHPQEVAVRYQLEGSLYETGSKLLSAGNPGAALPLFEEARRLTEEWIAAEPGNVRAERTLALDLKKIAEATAESGDLAGALRIMRESMDIRRRLSALDPNNAGWRRDLAAGEVSLAEWLERSGAPSDALARYEAARHLLVPLFEADQDNVLRRVDVAEASNGIGLALTGLGRTDAAYAPLAAARSLLEATPEPQRGAHVNQELAETLAGLALLAARRDRLAEAIELMSRAVALQDAHIAGDRFNVYARRDLGRMRLELGRLLARCPAASAAVPQCIGAGAGSCEQFRMSDSLWREMTGKQQLAPDFGRYAREAERGAAACAARLPPAA